MKCCQKVRGLYWLLMFISAPVWLCAQTANDSVFNALKHEVDTAKKGDKIRAYLKIASYVRSKEPLAAIPYIDSIIKIAEATNDSLAFSVAYNSLAQTMHYLGDYEKAIEYSNKAILLDQQMKNNNGLQNNLSNSGVYYEALGQDSMAMVQYNEAYRLFNEHGGDSLSLANLLNNMANILVNKGEKNRDTASTMKAIAMFKKVYRIDKKYSGSYWMSKSLNNLGNAFNDVGIITAQNRFRDSALYYLKKSAYYKFKVDDKIGLVSTLGNIGLCFAGKKQLDSARYYKEQSMQFAQETKAPDGLAYAHQGLMEQYELEGNYKKALYHAQRMSTLHDSLVNLQNGEKIATMQARYDNLRKEEENQLLLAQKAKTDLRLEKSRSRQTLLAAAIILLLLVVAFIIIYLRQRQARLLQIEKSKQQKLRFKAIIEGEEKERVRIAQELHDSLGQMVTAAKLNLSAMKNPDDEKSNKLKQNATSIMDALVGEIRNISHNLMPADLIKLGLVTAIDSLVTKINEARLLRIEFDYNKNMPRMEQSVEIALYRVVQEVLNNMIKHAQAKLILVQLYNDGGKVHLKISDDGTGFDTTTIEKSSGIGWKNIFSRLSLIDGKIDIDSKLGQGTTIHIDVAA